MALENLKPYSQMVLRIGMAAVFLWFGINQVFNPGNFIGYLPEFIFSSGYANAFVYANGIFEIVLGSMLAAGLFTRVAAFLLSIHLIAIIIELGYGETFIRDAGLMIATFSVFIGGEDKWCLDYKMKSAKK